MARALARRNPHDQTLLRILAEAGEIVLKTVPIDEAEHTSTVALTSVMDDDRVRRLKVDGPGLVERQRRDKRRGADGHGL